MTTLPLTLKSHQMVLSEPNSTQRKVRNTCSGSLYRLGPETPYERVGDVGNVDFPCGFTIGDDGNSINMYYGAADTSMALATGSIKALLRGPSNGMT